MVKMTDAPCFFRTEAEVITEAGTRGRDKIVPNPISEKNGNL